MELDVDAVSATPSDPMAVEPALPIPTSYTSDGRPIRLNRGRLPARYTDWVPEGPVPLPVQSEEDVVSDVPGSVFMNESGVPEASLVPPLQPVCTSPNSFGLMREYVRHPLHDPDDGISAEDLMDGAQGPVSSSPDNRSTGTSFTTPYAPYPNRSSYLLGDYYWNGSTTKSKSDFKDLCNILQDPEFIPADIKDTKWDTIDQQLSDDGPKAMFNTADGWCEGSVKIPIPSGKKGVAGAEFKVFASERSKEFHFEPYRLLWQALGSTTAPQEVYGEMYSSSAFCQVHADLQASPPEPGCDLPRAVVACMVWSDSTHLAEFGNASLWPVYLSFGNQSKYERGKPSAKACHHIAYIPKLPDNVQDFIREQNGKEATAQMLAHCRCELMHTVWKLLLGDHFEEACRHGIVVRCGDGIMRRLYPRFFTYSADYPEKVLLATIRDMGGCPCPRCLIAKKDIHQLATVTDMRCRHDAAHVDDDARRSKVRQAQKFIYELGYVVNSAIVDEILKAESLVLTENAFAARLAEFLTSFFELFVPDFLHEWELGVWKQILIHLIRILHAVKGGKVQEFDARFRQVPIFGHDTIRKFSANVSEMKKLAARNFEDILQSSELHGLHKLRIHTEHTLAITEQVTTDFAQLIRRFKSTTCAAFDTVELLKEKAACLHRQAHERRPTNGATLAVALPAPSNVNIVDAIKPQRKEFNMDTYKCHSLGDYLRTIREHGTTDSYTTQIGELEHRQVKQRFERTSKKDYTKQLAAVERQQSRLQDIGVHLGTSRYIHDVVEGMDEETLSIPADVHYHIAASQKDPSHIPTWLRHHAGDPATCFFMRHLKDFLLDIMDDHKGTPSPLTLQLNYTTYDVRREQDTINPSTDRRDVMVLTDDDDPHAHPFWYARVLGIYHVNTIDLSLSSQAVPRHVEFLFVRWFGIDPDWSAGWGARQLDHIGFVPGTDDDAFSFISPAHVLRACHLIPAFAEGRTRSLLMTSRIAHRESEHEDWEHFYVNCDTANLSVEAAVSAIPEELAEVHEDEMEAEDDKEGAEADMDVDVKDDYGDL
ncbi:hypothetical protein BKA93DRAFT_827245 [Sparassis latifolia]